MLDLINTDPETWFDVPYQGAESSVDVREIKQKEATQLTGIYAPCRCWRCRGGVALSDRPILDRLLAKHILAQSSDAAAAFLYAWAAHPRHDATAHAQLNAWLRILTGSGEPEPEYPVDVIPGAA